ncbi:MAG: DNA methyltransferase [Gemmataceae bacterium]
MTKPEISNLADLPPGANVFATWPLVSPGYSEHNSQTIKIGSTENPITLKCPSNKHWTVGVEGTVKLWKAERLLPKEGQRIYKRYLSDFAATPLSNQWTDSRGELRPQYVVQTSSIIVQRCMLMTTDPGDLVLDPTCGSGTTAYVAEQWGRRWITIDTSRVAVAIARHRILTKGLFPYYELCEESKGPSGGFRYHSIPYISYSVVANNQNLDPILARHDQILDDKLVACNHALSKVTNEQRVAVQRKLWAKQNQAGKKSITDADRRRWELPKSNNWEHWTVPFDTDYDWPEELQQAVNAYRQAWRAKMDEVNECIAANAEQQELVDQPIKVKGVIRVSGPFTVESVQPPQMSLSDVIDTLSPIGGEPESLDTFASARTIREVGLANEYEVQNIDAYLDQMVRLLRQDGVRFPDNKQQNFTRLDRITGSNALHAEGRWVTDGEEDSNPEGRATVAVGFGPQYGPVTALQVEELIRAANRSGYDELVIAGFSFDGAAQAIIDEDQHPKLRVHQANIRPDVNPGMNGLLKEQPGSQLFTVFGQPRTRVDGPNSDGEYVVTMEGVDIYDPVSNTVIPTNKEKVAAWFIDGDYDGRTFCITQAFFPDRKAWDKLAKALKGVIDQDAFEAFSGTESLPFPAGKHKCVAVKVIDPRGNEVMQIHRLDTSKK